MIETLTLAPATGEQIVVDRLGGRGPTYLFLHGLGSVRAGEKSTALFRHAAARGRAAARFDFRGHGGSTGTIGIVTVSELIADATAVLDLVGPSVLVGSSLGGLVAAFLAASRPADATALVLLAPALGFLPRMARRLDAEGCLTTGEGVTFRVDPRVLDDAGRLDEASLPSRLPMPVLVVHGTADEVVPARLSERFFAAIPHARKDLWLVPDGDHRLNRQIEAICARMDAVIG